MISHGAVIMATSGIIVSNIGLESEKFNAQITEFVNKSRLVAGLKLRAVKNEETLRYLDKNAVDFILFWDKDIYLARTLEARGYQVFNNPEAIYLCDDKALTAVALEKANVVTPPFYVFPLHFSGNIVEHYPKYKDDLLSLGFPLVVKDRHGSFGEQVYLARNEEELIDLLNRHGEKPLIAQKYLRKHAGEDYRVNVVGDEVVLTVKRQNMADFRSNINQGGTATPFTPTAAMKDLAVAATKAVNAHFAGVDVMINDEGHPVVIEVNSNMRTVAVNRVSDNDLTLAILNYIVKAL